MKIAATISALAVLGTAHAFAPTAFVGRPTSVSFMSQVDSSEAVKAAMEAGEKFGKTSVEARMAWELVEEIDASNSHEKASDKQKAKAATEKSAPAAVAAPAQPTVHKDTADAVKNALEASKVYGATSTEARIAWDIVEELDAANSHHRGNDIHVKQEAKPKPVKVEEPQVTLSKPPKNVEDAIAAALLASKVYGKSSKEARMAFEIVEEMDAAVSHAKPAPAKAEPVQSEQWERITSVHTDTSDAIKEALAASQEFGPTSSEARMAWEKVEEMDAANSHHKITGTG